jgi:hypothetical protein
MAGPERLVVCSERCSRLLIYLVEKLWEVLVEKIFWDIVDIV